MLSYVINEGMPPDDSLIWAVLHHGDITLALAFQAMT